MQSISVRTMLGRPGLLEVPSVMLIEPHPDDNEVGAGGTVKLLTQIGVEVTYLTVTDGRLGSEDPAMTAEEMVRLRMGERQRVNQMLGVQQSYNLGFADGGEWSEHQLMQVLVPLIRQFRPALIMTVDPWAPYESHPDHIKTGKAVAAALIYSKNGIAFKGQGEPYAVPQIAFYGTSYPNTFIDVSETWHTKLDAMKGHASQFDLPNWPLISGFLTSAAGALYREHYGTEREGYVEAFKLLAAEELHFFPDAMRS